MNTAVFQQRRLHLFQAMADNSVALIASGKELNRNRDTHYPFRPQSDFYFLTGFNEPDAVLMLSKTADGYKSHLWCRAKDKEKEIWDGFRYGPEGAELHFKIDKAYPVKEFETKASGLLKGVDRIYYRLFKNPEMDKRVQTIIEEFRVSQGRTGYGILPIFDPEEILAEMRVIKSDHELELMRMACRISGEAHIAAMKATQVGKNEWDLHNLIVYEMKKLGATREGYNGIVASGKNATTLHYTFNDCPLKDGELLLVDAGAEYQYYTGDITRTYPINGKFTDEQALVYDGVLKVQKTKCEVRCSVIQKNQ